MKILAQRLRELREEKNMSRKMVADQTSMVERTYQRYENAEREPTASALVELADLYGVSIDYLVGRTDQRD